MTHWHLPRIPRSICFENKVLKKICIFFSLKSTSFGPTQSPVRVISAACALSRNYVISYWTLAVLCLRHHVETICSASLLFHPMYIYILYNLYVCVCVCALLHLTKRGQCRGCNGLGQCGLFFIWNLNLNGSISFLLFFFLLKGLQQFSCCASPAHQTPCQRGPIAGLGY